MKPIWKGSLAILGIPMPVEVYTPYEPSQTALNECHVEQDQNGNVTHIAPVGYRRYCKGCGHTYQEGEKRHRGKKVGDQYIPILEEELDAIRPQSSKVIEIQGCWSAQQLEQAQVTLYLENQYPIRPQEISQQFYKIVLDTLQASRTCLYGKICMRTSERLCVITPEHGILILRTLRYPEEVRTTELDLLRQEVEAIQVGEKELKMGKALLRAIDHGQSLQDYHDGYAENLEKLVQAKIAGGTYTVQTKEPEPKPDLLQQLAAAIQKAQAKPQETS